MTYPPPDPPPTGQPLAPEQPHVPGANLPAPGTAPETYRPGSSPAAHGHGTAPNTYGYGPPPAPPADPYGYGTPPAPPADPYGYGTPPAPPADPYGYGTPPAPTPEPYGYGLPPGPAPAPYGYGTPPPYYPANPYQYAPRPTEGLAIAALVVSCTAALGICTWGIGGLLGIVGAILGHVARSRIRNNGNNGAGMALAGIIVGWILAAVGVVMLVGIVFVMSHDIGSVRRT